MRTCNTSTYITLMQIITTSKNDMAMKIKFSTFTYIFYLLKSIFNVYTNLNETSSCVLFAMQQVFIYKYCGMP